MPSALNQIVSFGLLVLFLSIGFGALVGQGPGAMGVLNWYRRHLTRFVRWAWHEYWRFIVGFAVGVLTALYFTGRLP